jgi:hypothetical protein
MIMGRSVALVASALAAAGAFAIESRPCAAQSNVAAAARAYSLGQQAELAGDFRAASEHYELADRMVPSPEALRSAVRTRLKAGDEATAATRAEALAHRYRDDRSQALAAETLKGLRTVLARVSLTCSAPCAALVDGGALGIEESREHIFYLEPGQHRVTADFGTAGSQEQAVSTEAGKPIVVSLDAPERGAGLALERRGEARDAARPHGLRLGWFVASGAVTIALAGVTVWSGLDVLEHNDAYERDPTREKLEDGQSRERRTDILLGVSLAAAVTTGIIALNTRWSPAEAAEPAASLGVAPVAGGAVVVVEGTTW